jgi:hypothetical protein
MNIKKSLPRESYTKVSNSFWSLTTLSDGAKVLYGLVASFPNGKTVHDVYLAKVLGVSLRTITNRKEELKAHDYLLMVQLAPRVYDLYIGYPGYPASKVRQVWEQDT